MPSSVVDCRLSLAATRAENIHRRTLIINLRNRRKEENGEGMNDARMNTVSRICPLLSIVINTSLCISVYHIYNAKRREMFTINILLDKVKVSESW